MQSEVPYPYGFPDGALRPRPPREGTLWRDQQ